MRKHEPLSIAADLRQGIVVRLRAPSAHTDEPTNLGDGEKLGAAPVQSERALTEACSSGSEADRSRSHANTEECGEGWAGAFNREVWGARLNEPGDETWRNDGTGHSY